VRAKDYARQYIEAGQTPEALIAVVNGMRAEILELKDKRSVSTDAGLKSIVHEIEQKYDAFARIVGLPEGGFKVLMQIHLGPMYRELMSA
jgi:hypothetical protein